MAQDRACIWAFLGGKHWWNLCFAGAARCSGPGATTPPSRKHRPGCSQVYNIMYIYIKPYQHNALQYPIQGRSAICIAWYYRVGTGLLSVSSYSNIVMLALFTSIVLLCIWDTRLVDHGFMHINSSCVKTRLHSSFRW